MNGAGFRNDREWTEKMIRGSAKTPAKKRSLEVVDDVRDRVISMNGGDSFIFDVFALDIQRGRDHGLVTWGQIREDFEI